MDRYIAALRQVELKASGKDCMILTTNSTAVANNLNELEMNEKLYRYLKENASIDKVVFVVKETVYNEAVQKFVQLRNNGALPQPMKVERYPDIEEKKGEALGPEDLLRQLLGDDDILKVYD